MKHPLPMLYAKDGDSIHSLFVDLALSSQDSMKAFTYSKERRLFWLVVRLPTSPGVNQGRGFSFSLTSTS